jgi:hypothetical protein
MDGLAIIATRRVGASLDAAARPMQACGKHPGEWSGLVNCVPGCAPGVREELR